MHYESFDFCWIHVFSHFARFPDNCLFNEPSSAQHQQALHKVNERQLNFTLVLHKHHLKSRLKRLWTWFPRTWNVCTSNQNLWNYLDWFARKYLNFDENWKCQKPRNLNRYWMRLFFSITLYNDRFMCWPGAEMWTFEYWPISGIFFEISRDYEYLSMFWEILHGSNCFIASKRGKSMWSCLSQMYNQFLTWNVYHTELQCQHPAHTGKRYIQTYSYLDEQSGEKSGIASGGPQREKK